MHATLLPNALYNLTKFHENSSKGKGVMGRTRFHLQTDGQTDGQRPGQSLYPPNIRVFLSESFQFLEVKLSIYLNLNRHVFVMTTRLLEKKENTTFWSLCFYSGFTQLSTIFQSHRDGVWMWQGAGAQCSLLG